MADVATFELLPTDDWFPTIFSLPEGKPLNDRFALLDLNTHWFLMNMGCLYFIFLYLFIRAIIHLLVKYCAITPNTGKMLKV